MAKNWLRIPLKSAACSEWKRPTLLMAWKWDVVAPGGALIVVFHMLFSEEQDLVERYQLVFMLNYVAVLA